MMKFLQLLAKGLDKWPRGINAITQDISTAVWGFSSDKAFPVCRERSFWYSPYGVDLGMREIGIDDVALSTDHATAIVTRADWEAERAKLKAPKANGGGWVHWRGGNCPIGKSVLVDVRHRDGCVYDGVFAQESLAAMDWTHTKNPGDIMAYRIHKPAEQLDPAAHKHAQPAEQDSTGPDLHGMLRKIDGPDVIKWRDRIRELDTQRAEVESTYQRQISEITQERESLVQKLAGEGFSLIGDKPGALLTWQRYAKDGMKINAIKEYRELTGAGLREAKEAVEKYQDSLD